jgi:hypothetical protein
MPIASLYLACGTSGAPSRSSRRLDHCQDASAYLVREQGPRLDDFLQIGRKCAVWCAVRFAPPGIYGVSCDYSSPTRGVPPSGIVSHSVESFRIKSQVCKVLSSLCETMREVAAGCCTGL